MLAFWNSDSEREHKKQHLPKRMNANKVQARASGISEFKIHFRRTRAELCRSQTRFVNREVMLQDLRRCTRKRFLREGFRSVRSHNLLSKWILTQVLFNFSIAFIVTFARESVRFELLFQVAVAHYGHKTVLSTLSPFRAQY